jgi:hypothetical protein
MLSLALNIVTGSLLLYFGIQLFRYSIKKYKASEMTSVDTIPYINIPFAIFLILMGVIFIVQLGDVQNLIFGK